MSVFWAFVSHLRAVTQDKNPFIRKIVGLVLMAPIPQQTAHIKILNRIFFKSNSKKNALEKH